MDNFFKTITAILMFIALLAIQLIPIAIVAYLIAFFLNHM